MSRERVEGLEYLGEVGRGCEYDQNLLYKILKE